MQGGRRGTPLPAQVCPFLLWRILAEGGTGEHNALRFWEARARFRLLRAWSYRKGLAQGVH